VFVPALLGQMPDVLPRMHVALAINFSRAGKTG
jgi:hypothetical protein